MGGRGACAVLADRMPRLWGAFLLRADRIPLPGCVPPAGQRKRPHTTSTQPLSLQITMGTCAVLIMEPYQFLQLPTRKSSPQNHPAHFER